MALSKRILNITISLPGGDVVLGSDIDVKVKVYKAALAIQSRASIEITGMTTSLRQQLLSQFTAWHKRQVESGQAAADWINVKIEAGYEGASSVDSTASNTAVVFLGQIALVDYVAGPPDITVRITCYSRQIDKTSFVTSPAPSTTTYLNYVKWAAEQMGMGENFICDTSFNDVIVTNPAATVFTRAALLVDIQNLFRPDVAAFIDNDQLIVKDRNKVINVGAIAELKEFIGTPMWTEWGATFVTLMNPSIKLAQAATITSMMNPGVNNTYVITEIEYDLTTRDNAFYIKASGSPPA